MFISETKLSGLLVIEPQVFEDSRGNFLESYNKGKLKEAGIDLDFLQDNQSLSKYGVIRGLHYQLVPYAQVKLVRVVYGAVLDIVVDLRQGSLTFGHYYSIELSAKNNKQLFIPQGFAHGFAVLSGFAVFSYKCDKYYMPDFERGINFRDPDLAINWQIPDSEQLVSTKDLALPPFSEAEMNYYL